MRLVLICLLGLTVAEVLLWLPSIWKVRKLLAGSLSIGYAVFYGALVGVHPSAWSILFVFFGLYKIVNLARIFAGRTLGDYLFDIARRTSYSLLLLQLIVLGAAWLDNRYQPSSLTLWEVASLVQLAFAIVIYGSVRRNSRTTRPPQVDAGYADRDLPSITVAIPARNETEDLHANLKSLIASSYPKLEILVLDDCSQNKRTPEIIRSFAHDGVRFIAGKATPKGWLAKNYAYHQLAEEANGEIILFCGVDVRFEAQTVTAIIESLLYKKKQMVSVMPRNAIPAQHKLLSTLIQPFRYAWELALPRRWLQRPPVLSTCWAITSGALHASGGFDAVKRSSSPESYFARTVAVQDGYSFMASDRSMGLSCDKQVSEQRDTAIRTRYPQLHRRPEIASLLTLAELSVLVVPFSSSVAGGLLQHWVILAINVLTGLTVVASYQKMTTLTYRKFIGSSLWLAPFAAIYDCCLLNYSLYRL